MHRNFLVLGLLTFLLAACTTSISIMAYSGFDDNNSLLVIGTCEVTPKRSMRRVRITYAINGGIEQTDTTFDPATGEFSHSVDLSTLPDGENIVETFCYQSADNSSSVTTDFIVGGEF